MCIIAPVMALAHSPPVVTTLTTPFETDYLINGNITTDVLFALEGITVQRAGESSFMVNTGPLAISATPPTSINYTACGGTMPAEPTWYMSSVRTTAERLLGGTSTGLGSVNMIANQFSNDYATMASGAHQRI